MNTVIKKISQQLIKISFSRIYFCFRTADIFDASDFDLRASIIGENDSSNISWALSPGPVVSANRPTKRANKCLEN